MARRKFCLKSPNIQWKKNVTWARGTWEVKEVNGSRVSLSLEVYGSGISLSLEVNGSRISLFSLLCGDLG